MTTLLAPLPAQPTGLPAKDPEFDVLAGFQAPPKGYGEVPFWWWTGDPLDRERLIWQIEELHRKGITGMQVNYAHKDTPGWPTYPAEPEIFTDEWWNMWKFVAEECGKRGMGIGLSGYTLDWPRGDNLFNRIIYSDPVINGREIRVDTVVRADPTHPARLAVSGDRIAIWAYLAVNGIPQPGGRDLGPFVTDGHLEWKPRQGEWQIWVFSAPRIPGTLNPIHPLAGKAVVDKFFQPFEDHAANQTSEGLNYFFQDELQFGVGDIIWADDLRDEFARRKGYDLLEVMPALFTDIGTKTPKARLDFLDVKVALSEERYFIPVFNWHNDRGLIYGADPEGRGLNPGQYGDNFRVQRWYTAPGHDTPGGQADLIKGKVSSSIAALYNRPRVWLEGYHSLGWGATPERLMYATCENYLYGCNLLNLHGLYYTTHGSFWEWAPPCYHFRMPYWDHMPVFLKYFERLSYLMSQGTLVADIAILYPVSPFQARMDGPASAEAAFTAGRQLFPAGYDFIFIDDQSMELATATDGSLRAGGLDLKVLILPSVRAIRWTTISKALEFFRNGGVVINIGPLPEASDRIGSEDPLLDEALRELFGTTAAEHGSGHRPDPQVNASGGSGWIIEQAADVLPLIRRLLRPPVWADQPVRAQHRKIGTREVFLIMDADEGSWCTFRAKGRAELWDPWDGSVSLLPSREVDDGTAVRMPLGRDQARIIVFTPEDPGIRGLAPVNQASGPVGRDTIRLEGPWDFWLKPTMDNRFGDFRLPVTDEIIGAEARIFRYQEEQGLATDWEKPGFDDSGWTRVTHGFGPKFWKLGPLPADSDLRGVEENLASLTSIEPAEPVQVPGKNYYWAPYDFSWRWGREGDPGHQGWHGLKKEVTDHFICLGKPSEGLNELVYGEEPGGSRYYLWTSAFAERDCQVAAEQGGLLPAVAYSNGQMIEPADFHTVALIAGSNPLLLRYDSPGRGFFTLFDNQAGPSEARTPLSMSWHDRLGRIPLDIRSDEERPAGWYRFTAPPGLRSLEVVAYGTIRIWVDGAEQQVDLAEAGNPARYRIRVKGRPVQKSIVAIRIEAVRGEYGGSALPEPIRLDCGVGLSEPGDWSVGSVLENYSGGAWYRTTFGLTKAQSGSVVLVDLGEVVATAEVRVNGKTAGILVCPPWSMDVTGLVKPGRNTIEVLVYNTLANHYLTIPSRYKGEIRKSGLIGPVRLKFYDSD
ncbi:MAG: glycosyl hydrolase [Bacteroidales bacterium]